MVLFVGLQMAGVGWVSWFDGSLSYLLDYWCDKSIFDCLMLIPKPGGAYTCPSLNTSLPRRTSRLTFPFTFLPSKGVHPHRVKLPAACISPSSSGSTSTQVSGCSGRSKIRRG